MKEATLIVIAAAIAALALIDRANASTMVICNMYAKPPHEAKRRLFYADNDDNKTPPATQQPAGTSPGSPTAATGTSATHPAQPIIQDATPKQRQPWQLECDETLIKHAQEVASRNAKADKNQKSKEYVNTEGENIFKATHVAAKNTQDARTVQFLVKKNNALENDADVEAVIQQAVDSWFAEMGCYIHDANRGGGDSSRQYSAMMWKEVSRIGIGVAVSANRKSVYVVAKYQTPGGLPPNTGGISAFISNVPTKPMKPIPGAEGCNRQPDAKSEKAVEPTLFEIINNARKLMPSWLDAKVIYKERNKIARIAMYMCENDKDLRQEFAVLLANEKDRKNEAMVNQKINEVLCGKDPNMLKLVGEYMYCVQRTSKLYEIDYWLKTSLRTESDKYPNPEKTREVAKEIKPFAYDRKIAQHRCDRMFFTPRNAALYWGLSIEEKYPLLARIQKRLPHNKNYIQSKCAESEKNVIEGLDDNEVKVIVDNFQEEFGWLFDYWHENVLAPPALLDEGKEDEKSPMQPKAPIEVIGRSRSIEPKKKTNKITSRGMEHIASKINSEPETPKLLGKGDNAVVFKVAMRGHKRPVALKISRCGKVGKGAEILRELATLNLDFVIKWHANGVSANGKYEYLAMELTGKSLAKRMVAQGEARITPAQFKTEMLSILGNLPRLHSQEGHFYAHGDLHLGNVAEDFANPNRFVINDWDMATKFEPDDTEAPINDYAKLLGNTMVCGTGESEGKWQEMCELEYDKSTIKLDTLLPLKEAMTAYRLAARFAPDEDMEKELDKVEGTKPQGPTPPTNMEGLKKLHEGVMAIFKGLPTQPQTSAAPPSKKN